MSSERSIEMEIEKLLLSDEATLADMAVALQKLRESEERYRLFADNVRDVIWLRDMNLNLKYITPSVMAQRGYTVEEAKAITLEENWTPDSFKYVREVFSEELEIEKNEQKDMSRSRTIEVEVTCKDGSTIWTEAKMSFLRDKNDEPIGIIGVTRNITERKQAEDALRESEEKYRNLIERANDGIIIVQDGIVKFVNNRMADLFGYNIGEMHDTPFLDYVFPDKRNIIKELHERRLKEEDVPDIYEMQALHKDGRKLDIETNSGIITYLGKPAVLAFIRDIAERKRAEEALQKAHDELKERAIDLEIKRKGLEELNTAMRVLLKKRDADKAKIEKYVLANVKQLIEPYFKKIKKTKLNAQQEALLRIVESNLNEIISPFMQEVSLKHFNLTPTEIQIAKQIRYGDTTQKIAQFMNVSPRTVETHRKNIRRKIGLEGKKANLRSYLLSIN